ncbi:MAG: hypothetical protein JO040_02520 [Gemmatimonadetes bacterium]|nr:hypothetical protein [Gemmatimonadota bacterium]
MVRRMPFSFAWGTVPGALLALSLAGCAAAGPPAIPAGPPAPDPQPVAEQLVRATAPTAPRQVTFGWELDEAGARFRGRGVVRMEGPDRLRLDLFGPRGETYLAAAMVGDSVRAPAALASMIALPSPSLLWGALGVVRPPTSARLLGATGSDSGASSLRYEAAAGETVEFGATNSRLSTVRRVGRSNTLETVALGYSPQGALTRAEYRNWAAYRTLVLNIETIENVAAFPEATWNPGGAAR